MRRVTQPNCFAECRLLFLCASVLLFFAGSLVEARTLPPARVGVHYEYTVRYSGLVEPVKAAWEGLPEWLEADGPGLQGVPEETRPDPMQLNLTLTGQLGKTVSEEFSMSILPTIRPLLLAKEPLPPIPMGESIEYVFPISGGQGKLHWQTHWIEKIPGLTVRVDTDNGLCILKGKAQSRGTFRLRVSVRDETGAEEEHTFTGHVRALTEPLSISTATLPEGIVNNPYHAQIMASGGIPPYKWQLQWDSSAPAGIRGDENGAVAGTPSHAGRFPCTVTLSDAGEAERTARFTLLIKHPVYHPSIVANMPASGTVGTNYEGVLFALGSGEHVDWSLKGVPEWMEWQVENKVIGRLTGTPPEPGTWTIRANLSVQCPTRTPEGKGMRETATASKTVELVVTAKDIEPLRIRSAELPLALQHMPYRFALSIRGGKPPVKVSCEGTLPPGMSCTPLGVLRSDKIQSTGQFPLSFHVQSADGQNKVFKAVLRVVEHAEPASLHFEPVPDIFAALGKRAKCNLAIRGGCPPYKVRIEPALGLKPITTNKNLHLAFRLLNPLGAHTQVVVEDTAGDAVARPVSVRPAIPLKQVALALFLPLFLLLITVFVLRNRWQKSSADNHS